MQRRRAAGGGQTHGTRESGDCRQRGLQPEERRLPSRAEGLQSYPKGKGQWSGLINRVFQKVLSVCIAEGELVVIRQGQGDG